MVSVVVGAEDQREEFLFPHVTANFIEELGLAAFESRRPAAHVAAFFPSRAVIPMFDDVVFCSAAGVKSCEVDRCTKTMVTESAASSYLSTVVSSKMHHFLDPTLFEIVAKTCQTDSQFTTHRHFDALLCPNHPIDTHDRCCDANGLTDRATSTCTA